MEPLKGRHAARTSRGREELLFIALAMLRFSLAQPVVEPAGYNSAWYGYKPLFVAGNPSAIITELQEGDITCLGDFSEDFSDDEYGYMGLSLKEALPGQQGLDLGGRCLYKNPVQLMQANRVTSFSTMFQVRIQAEFHQLEFCGAGNASGTLQGLAFIIGTETSTQGAAKGYLGWLNSTTNALNSTTNSTAHNFAVEIDFFQDVQFQDPLETHVGIDSNSLTSIVTASMGWPSVSSSRVPSVLSVWIQYDGLAQKLEVYTTLSLESSAPSASIKPLRPILSTQIDLTELLSQDGMFLGLIGAISNVTISDNVPNKWSFGYIIEEWTFNSNGLAPDVPRNADGKMQLRYRTEASKRTTVRIIIVVVTIPPALLFLFLVLIIYKLYRRNARLAAIAKKYQIEEDLLEQGPQKFKHKVLSTATKGFSSRELLGKGGFGSVYKGSLRLKGGQKPTDVAVKRISATSHQGAREFLAEVKIIGQAQHRNLVRLLGWCHEKGELLLVYDYMPNGSVDQHLFHSSERELVLTWARRLKIISGVATALAYLHEEWEQRVIHRDVKSSNVMLDRDFNARLGDFGLARLSEHARPSTTKHSSSGGDLRIFGS